MKKFEETSEFGGVVIPNVSNHGSVYDATEQNSAKKFELYSPIKGYFSNKFRGEELLGKRQPFAHIQADSLVSKRMKSITNSLQKRGKENVDDDFKLELK